VIVTVFGTVVEVLIVVVGAIVVWMDAVSSLNVDTDVLDGL